MREIKFRAWNKEEKKIESMGQLFNCNNDWLQRLMLGQLKEDYNLMQFTGLKDKKGKEIYEGDIVKTDCGIKKVRFLDGSFVAYSDSNYTIYQFDDIEVIGNIHENSELLNKKEEK